MLKKLITGASLSLLLLNTAAFASADKRRGKTSAKRTATSVKHIKRASDELITLLPGSDAVISIDSRRAIRESIPQLFAVNKPLLTTVNGIIAELEAKTRLDIRKFDSIVFGGSLAPKNEGDSSKKLVIDGMLIARSSVDISNLLTADKLSAFGSFREETIGGNKVYIFSVKRKTETPNTDAPAPKSETGKAVTAAKEIAEDKVDLAGSDIAYTALDAKTIAVGSPLQIGRAIEHKTSVDPQLSELITRDPSAVAAFALRTPDGMGNLVPVENDQIGNYVNSIRVISGSIDTNPAGALLNLNVTTADAAAANELFTTLKGLKDLGKAFLSDSKRADQRRYGRLIEAVQLSSQGSNISLKLAVAKADLDAIIGGFK